MTSTGEVSANLDDVERLVRRAASRGATLIAIPENFAFIGDGTPAADARRLEIAEEIPGGPVVERMAKLARETKAHLVLGAMPEKAAGEPARAHNTSVVVAPDGAVAARYRKIHLFDVAFEQGPVIQESKSIAPGPVEPCLAKLPGLSLGLTICYDLRFPELYRALALGGAEAFTVPAAFTLHTGKDHWEVLLRARAIENGAFVLAPAQWGTHPGGRQTWGKSMIVDPWGETLAVASEGEGIAVAELDPDVLTRVRRALPTQSHVRLGRA
jgi:predicted amidohydrolase